MTYRKLYRLINKFARAKYVATGHYGNLTVAYDAPKIYAITRAELAARGETVDAATLASAIDANIVSGDYKTDTGDRWLLCLFFAVILLWIYIVIKK